MKTLQRVDEFIKSKGLILEDDKLLVTVSGGMDSMFLLHYLISKKYNLAVAHCNFGLRDEESDGDETFVKSFCEMNSLDFHVKKFETETYSKSHGISIQMAARDLRYQWFDELYQTENYTKIVTAHHKTDNAETILLNMVRGTGLKGLEGIAAISGKKIRPLLCLSRIEIESLVKELKIIFREDSSNKSDKYYRNKLRLNVLPELKSINPDYENTFVANAGIVVQANHFINYQIEKIKTEILKTENESTILEIAGLLKLPEPKYILYSILEKFGFNASETSDIFNGLNGISGKQFFSSSHRIIKDRGQLIIEPISLENLPIFEINKDTKTLITPHHLWSFEILDSNRILSLTESIAKNEACFDLEKLKFPLTIRPWQQGDKLKPLGMSGHKKVSDVLIDKKISLAEKEKIWVVVSANNIIWISGLIINEDYKIVGGTNNVLKIGLNRIYK